MTASIVGWAHTPFGKFDTQTVESLVVRVANDALADAGIAAADVDEIVLGHFNAGFSPQDFTAALDAVGRSALADRSGATRVENACATLDRPPSTSDIRAIAAGAAKIVLVVGVEQMTRTPPAEIGRNLLRASYLPEDGDTPGGFAGVFGKIAQAYFQKYGDQSDALAMIAAKNHKNGVANPYAQRFRVAERERSSMLGKHLVEGLRAEQHATGSGSPFSSAPAAVRRAGSPTPGGRRTPPSAPRSSRLVVP